MDPRYTHPEVTRLWSPVATYAAWAQIGSAVVKQQRQWDVIPQTSETEPLTTPLKINTQDVHTIRKIEKETKHDVAAYLVHARRMYDGQVPHSGRWLHYGLTSSDLVDTAQGMRFAAMAEPLKEMSGGLLAACTEWRRDPTMVIGRTHGQTAEPMSLGARADHWGAMLEDAAAHLQHGTMLMRYAKLSGPVGTFAHNPQQIEIGVSTQLGLIPSGDRSSQIVPRTSLAFWASAAATMVNVCAKIALDLRLMNLVKEVVEPQTTGQVGSSSMAHKNNPIRAEQIGGMARLASGYAQMLQPLDVWLERDISHSSVERVAVPDLWHVVMHTMSQTNILLALTRRNRLVMRENLQRAASATVVKDTLTQIRLGKTADAAREIALRTPPPGTPSVFSWFDRNYRGSVSM